MPAIEAILAETTHRPYAMPTHRWAYYQEWNNVLFLHWKVPVELLRQFVPKQLNIDTIDGAAYISIVPFTMQSIRPRTLPALTFISDFHEINVRTYIDNDNKKGVYFLNIEAEKILSVYVAKFLSGLPYEKAAIKRTTNTYHSINTHKGFKLNTSFKVQAAIHNKSSIDTWLTERYCLYLDNGSNMYRYDIHHKPWELKQVAIDQLEVQYKFLPNSFSNNSPDLQHYSDGVQVLAWDKVQL
jgi:hypothetical protein